MKTIGITGGQSSWGLGSAAEVQLFFDCLDVYVVRRQPTIDWRVLTDRLYKRYIRQEELDEAILKMKMLQDSFKLLPNQSIDWAGFDYEFDERHSKLNPSGATLDVVFSAYFDGFAHCAESAEVKYETFKDDENYRYDPVRFVITDIPWLVTEKMRPLSDYDALEGKPFWLVK